MITSHNLKQYAYVFGRVVESDWLNSDTVNELIAEACDKAENATRPDINCILDILDRVSQAWADPEYRLRKQAARLLPELTNFSPQMIEEGFAVISAICKRENLIKRLEGELGSVDYLDKWVAKPHLGHELRAVGHGALLHLTAGNVFVGAVDSLVCGIITKNANILKMSRVDPIFPLLFIESIYEQDPEGIVWPNQATLSWKGGDESIEGPLLNSPLTVVFWGGFEALVSIKSRLGHNTRLVENGPRYSFAAIEGCMINDEPDHEMVKGLALDLARWDQQACSSPHVVYVIADDELPLHQLMEALYDKLIELQEELPVGQLSFDEKVEIRKVREIARMLQARGEGRMMCPENFAFTLVYEAAAEFKVSCLNRTLFFKLVSSFEDLLEQIEPIGHFLQTVGMRCSEAIQDKLENELIRLGARRITGIGGMSEGHDGAPHEGGYMLRNLIHWISKEYSDNECARVERLLNSIKSSAYYSKLLKTPEDSLFSNFGNFPLLDRDTFYKNSPPASNDILTGPMTDAYVYASGGTTGEPKFTLYSNDEYRYVTDVLTEIYCNAGLTKDDRVANLFIAGNLWTSFNVAGRALENLGCLNLPVGGASDFDNILKYLKLFSVNAVVGLPSIIIKLAEEVEKRQLDISIEKILYGGEHLRPQTCDYLKKILGTTSIRSAGYACVDTGPVGWQCEHLEGTVHHVLDQYCFAEIIDTNDLTPIYDETPGEIIATNLDRVLMPVVRYRTGDMGRWVKVTNCPCGFSGRSFELLGRCDDLLVIGGINLMPVDVSAGLALLEVSQAFQIAAATRNGKDTLILRLEAENPIEDRLVIEALVKSSYKIAESIHEGWMNMDIEWFKPGEIKRNERTGKLKTVVEERF